MGDGKEASQVHCLNPKNGKIIWSSKPVGKTGGNYKGTRCTPTFDDGLLYALGFSVCMRVSEVGLCSAYLCQFPFAAAGAIDQAVGFLVVLEDVLRRVPFQFPA